MEKFTLKNFGDADELARTAVGDWLKLLRKVSGKYCVALSGGRIAKNFFWEVTKQAQAADLSLQNIDFFWADERCVPPGDAESNYLLAKENLLGPLSIPLEKIHRLKGEMPPDEAVDDANAAVESIAPKNKDGIPMFDMVFLGLGENGHIASLMPNLPAAAARSQSPYLRIKKSPKPPPDRISLSYAALAAAKNVWMLASGSGKEEALRESLKPNGTTPFARVLQSRAQTVIYSEIAI